MLLWTVGALIFVALAFDYINGFHDAANSIATVVSTRVLSPGRAVIWAAFFNFVAAFTFGTAVAKTLGAGMIDIKIFTFAVISGGFAALVPGGWTLTIVFIFLSPLIGLVAGLLLMTTNFWIFRWTPPSRVDRW